jgi:aspartyl-tRNA synthetase
MERTLISQINDYIGKKVTVYGWINSRRDHGKIVFVDLRDRTGILQAVCLDAAKVKKIGNECVVKVVGLIKKRPKHLINPRLTTGSIEMEIDTVTLLSESKELPIPIDTDGYEIKEESRMKYRYLDLRRSRMADNIRLRSKAAMFVRNYLTNLDFIEIETPILTKTTPEGARDFIVPSRLQPGSFYALPQSPQQYKQLLMVAGFERYFQLARCFRDEDPRADRAYGEFTQLDIEMSFVTREEVMKLAEDLFTKLIAEVFPKKHLTRSPWPRINHTEAIQKYHSDKPDLRNNKNDKDELAMCWIIDFPLFNKQTEADYFHGAGKKYAPSHHMFTAPHPDDISLLSKDPLKVRGQQYDMVLNGYEVGGGSIRIHDAKIQEKIFELIGFSSEQKKQFTHMLTAFSYGVPPHGGIAPGLDRFIFSALGEPSIREVMAFPATAGGKTAVMDAPSNATSDQLKELGIKTA